MHAEVPDTPPRRHRLTVEDYYLMAEVGILDPHVRTELIDGEIIDMPSPGNPHVGAVNGLNSLFSRALGDRAVVAVQNPVLLDEHSEPQPDLALLRPHADFYGSRRAGPGDVLLMVEVADSSLRYDRGVKVALYARHAIAEFWLIDVRGKRVTCYRDPGAAGYARVDEPGVGAPLPIPGIDGASVTLAPLFDD